MILPCNRSLSALIALGLIMLVPTPPQRHEIPRTWLEGRWELAREVLPPQDTTLLAPYVVQASDSVAYVFDGADARVKAIDRSGNLTTAAPDRAHSRHGLPGL